MKNLYKKVANDAATKMTVGQQLVVGLPCLFGGFAIIVYAKQQQWTIGLIGGLLLWGVGVFLFVCFLVRKYLLK